MAPGDDAHPDKPNPMGDRLLTEDLQIQSETHSKTFINPLNMSVLIIFKSTQFFEFKAKCKTLQKVSEYRVGCQEDL